MILGSHNTWSYLKPRKWWQKLLRFTAQCQREDLTMQYVRHTVRCFDLRLRFDDNGKPILVHGIVEYDYTPAEIEHDLHNLNDSAKANGDNPVFVRVILDTRTKRQYTASQREFFWNYCNTLEMMYPNLLFWCGRNLYDWEINYTFHNNPTCCERYASVCKPRLIDDWFPFLFAHRWNKMIIEQGTTSDILLVDFVDIR